MTEKQLDSAQRLAEEYWMNIERDRQRFRCELSRFFLKLPVPMSYEVWSELHKIIEEDKGDVE